MAGHFKQEVTELVSRHASDLSARRCDRSRGPVSPGTSHSLARYPEKTSVIPASEMNSAAVKRAIRIARNPPQHHEAICAVTRGRGYHPYRDTRVVRLRWGAVRPRADRNAGPSPDQTNLFDGYFDLLIGKRTHAGRCSNERPAAASPVVQLQGRQTTRSTPRRACTRYAVDIAAPGQCRVQGRATRKDVCPLCPFDRSMTRYGLRF